MNVRLQGALKLKPKPINGLKPRELSGLAWDADESLLYAVSDDGFIVHLRPVFVDGVLTDVKLVDAQHLRDPAGNPLEERAADAEGLVAAHSRNGQRGDTELSISFEVDPRIEVFRPDGTFVTRHDLPPRLRSPEAYANDNQELEALTSHPRFGLLTAPERPLKNQPDDHFRIYGLDDQTWSYLPIDSKYSSLVGMESMPNGDLLVLERRYRSILHAVIFSLRRLSFDDDGRSVEDVTEVAQFNNKKGWAIDNFEAVAWHEGNRYFMVSDDNDSPFQKTLLVYFEILDTIEPPTVADASIAP